MSHKFIEFWIDCGQSNSSFLCLRTRKTLNLGILISMNFMVIFYPFLHDFLC